MLRVQLLATQKQSHLCLELSHNLWNIHYAHQRLGIGHLSFVFTSRQGRYAPPLYRCRRWHLKMSWNFLTEEAGSIGGIWAQRSVTPRLYAFHSIAPLLSGRGNKGAGEGEGQLSGIIQTSLSVFLPSLLEHILMTLVIARPTLWEVSPRSQLLAPLVTLS